jgi:hypothetical protein
MGKFEIKWRRAALFFVGWTLVNIIFAGISYAAAIGENNKEFGFVSALRLNLVQFYLWAILSLRTMLTLDSVKCLTNIGFTEMASRTIVGNSWLRAIGVNIIARPA